VPVFNSVKRTLKNNDVPVMLAPSPFSKNKDLVFSKLKDARPADVKKNSLFRVRCSQCDFVYETCSSTIDVARTIAEDLKKPDTKLAKHFSEFPTHNLQGPPEVIKTFRNRLDVLHFQNVAADVRKIFSE